MEMASRCMLTVVRNLPRWRLMQYTKLIVLVCVGFFVVHVLLIPSPSESNDPRWMDVDLARKEHHNQLVKPSTWSAFDPLATLNFSKLHFHSLSESESHDLRGEDSTKVPGHAGASKPRRLLLPDELDPARVKILMLEENARQTIHNEGEFAPLSPTSVIIVVQVHNRSAYLRHLVDSLSKAKNIEHVLLIFSHDFYLPQINDIVKSIKFCKVMQIFYPFNMQVYHEVFPGEGPNDCPRNVKKPEAEKMKCTNWNHPDKFGHYREAKYTQTKHHWWWKLQYVFDSVIATRNHTGLVLIIEEDHYVTEDFLHVLQTMQTLRQQKHGECNILTLGNYNKKLPVVADSDRVDITMWASNKHNMGMALDRNTYKSVKKCSQSFCSYDDYNWDWSLMFVSQRCMLPKLVVMALRSARVLHIGECGLHKRAKVCQPQVIVDKIKTQVKPRIKMFPKTLTVVVKKLGSMKIPKANGGWGDQRDHLLCHNYSQPMLEHLQQLR